MFLMIEYSVSVDLIKMA